MILSRKRNRELAMPGAATAAASEHFRTFHDMNEKSYLKDLLHVATSGNAATQAVMDATNKESFLLDLLRRVTRDEQLSQVGLNSQELFLSVVLEWQRSSVTPAQSRATTPSPSSSRVAQFSMKDISSHLSSANAQPESAPQSPFVSSAASTEASSSESEGDDLNDITPPAKRARRKLDDSPSGEEVSPTSVHNVPRDLSPLSLDYLSSPSKKIGVYTPRSRQELLRKYMEKRARRLSQNTVRYRVRKTLANARPRVKGRFVKTEQPLTAALVQSMTTD